jgi:hypothetical protein
VHLLERFHGYTLSTLLEEDAELLSLVAMVERGKPPNADSGMPGVAGMPDAAGGGW